MLRHPKIVKFNFLMKIVTVLFIFCFSNSWGQAILQWNTFGNLGTETTEASIFNDPNLSVSNLTQSGITAAGNANRFGGSNWFDAGNSATSTLAEAIAGNNYMQFIVTPAAGCSVTPTSFVFSWDKSGTGPQNVALRSSADGFAANLGLVAPTAAIGTFNTITIAGLTNVGTTTFRLYGYGATATGGTGGFDIGSNIVNVQLNGSTICSSCVEPTIAASSPVETQIGCNGFNLSWTNGDGTNRLVVVSTSPITSNPVDGVTYTANSSYGSGSTIGANQYAIYNGTGSTDYILGLAANTLYYYKFFEFNYCAGSPNYLTSGTVPGGDVTTTNCSSPAGITAVYIDACAGGCGFEGNNELIWGTTGSYAMNVATNGPTLHYNATTPPNTTFISTYSINATNITTLNNADGACGASTFVDPNALGYIPPNSTFLIANNCMCSPSAYDFSGLCNSGPIYVVFGTNAAWPCNDGGGIFGNESACNGNPRYFDLNFTTWGVATTPIYDYDPCLLTSGTNGDIITLNPAGGSATSYTNSGCVVPTLVLPIELIDFYGTQNGSANDLLWKVASEKNVSQYIIGKSEDGISFSEMTRINAIGTEVNLLNYSCEDPEPFAGITYYRLSTLEGNQTINHHKIIDLNRGNKDWKSLIYQENDQLIVDWKNYVPKDATVILFDLSGKQLANQNVFTSQTKINTNGFASGIYFVRISTPYKTENFKIVIQ